MLKGNLIIKTSFDYVHIMRCWCTHYQVLKKKWIGANKKKEHKLHNIVWLYFTIIKTWNNEMLVF